MVNHPQILQADQMPSGIADLPHPPRQMYLIGVLPTRPMVAMVGTRRPTSDAVKFAEDLASSAVREGLAVVSGGAEGIDAAAHRGALSAGGQTLVVAPAGWHYPYPECNRHLFQDIVENGGGYLSLVEPDKRPVSGHFFARNAVLVALASATVVVQAPIRSGARNAAYVARKLRRLIYAVPSSPWIERGAGCVIELRLGARPLGSIGDLLAGLADIGILGKRDPLQLKLPSVSRANCTPGYDGVSLVRDAQLDVSPLPDWTPIIDAIACGCNSLDTVCRYSGLGTPKVQAALLHLSLIGRIRMTSAGRIELVTISK